MASKAAIGAIAAGVMMAACGAPAPGYRPAFVDPSLGAAPEEAIAEWRVATGGRYPTLHLDFWIGPVGGAAVVSQSGDGAYRITVSDALAPSLYKRALLHELGHAAGLAPEPESGDPHHYRGAAPSVMHPIVEDCSDEIGAPELAAFDLKYGR